MNGERTNSNSIAIIRKNLLNGDVSDNNVFLALDQTGFEFLLVCQI
jgi:hypothetical protein